MASYKPHVKAAIAAAIHEEFPSAKVEALQEDGSLGHELELWLERFEDNIPSAWRRDWTAMALKYAFAALAGEGVQWEPKKTFLVFEGDPVLCIVRGPVPTRLVRNGAYASRKGRRPLCQEYTPHLRATGRQGEGDTVFIDGKLHHIYWPVHTCELPAHMQPKPGAIWDEEVFGDRFI
jgi:hypothetical protein